MPKKIKKSRRKSYRTKYTGPKKPITPYMFFSTARRKTLKLEMPDLNLIEHSKVIGQEWHRLSDAQKVP